MIPTRSASIASVALLFLACGCASADSSKQPAASAQTTLEPVSRPASPIDFVAMFHGYFADYDHVTPKTLATSSKLVVRGSIRAIVEGRTQLIDEVSGFTDVSLVAQVEVTEVYKGSLPVDSGKVVYVELPRVGETAAIDYDAVLPVRNEVVLYLVPSRPGDETIQDPDAGRPAGQPIFAPINPEGFWMAAPEGAVAVLEGAESSQPIEATLPSSSDFPPMRS